MSEEPLSISNINDFIFCPVSIYFHSLEEETENLIGQDLYQINGSTVHEKSDSATYSTKASMLQGMSIYSEKYNLIGKIDVFDSESGVLTERKNKINTIFDGYVFQVYAQYFSLTEMGYTVKELRLYSMSDNKIYKIPKPERDMKMFEKFETTIKRMKSFSFEEFSQENTLKCEKCIYEPLCSYSALKG